MKIHNMYEVETLEQKCINQDDSLVQVSFELPGHNWYELSMSQEWKAVENWLFQMKEKSEKMQQVQTTLHKINKASEVMQK